jgi:cytochrome c biogenesis protein ResB
VRSEVDGDLVHVRGDRNRMARLATLVTHAAVLLLVLGVALSSVLGWREELTLGRGEAADVGAGRRWGGKDFQPSNGGSGLRVRSEGFSILRYADGTVAGYEAQVEISQAGLDTMRGQIRLNEPLSYRGVAFTLYGYSSNGESQSITLQAVHDPGYGLSVASGLMMFLGMTVSFNFPPCCVYVRVQPGGVLRLAGRADRRAWGFARQFAALVDEIRGSTGTYTDS